MTVQLRPTLHARLRSETSTAHQRLERSLDLLRPPLDQERFTALLIRFHGFHRAWEPALAKTLPLAFVPEPRVPLIEQDLHALGMDDAGIDAIPLCAQAASLGDHAETAMGSVYVLEGSTLGGRVIGRHLAEAAWLPLAGLRYFDPYGDETASNWRQTLARLGAAGGDGDRIVAGAVRTFMILQDWLAPALHPEVTAGAAGTCP